MTSTVSGVHWKANYGEISEKAHFRIGKIESDTWEASFPISELADLISVLQDVTPLPVGVIQKGIANQARKVYAGFFTDIVVEPRSDTGVPAETLRFGDVELSDLLYVLQLLAADLANRFPDDWDFSDVETVMAFDKYGQVTDPDAAAYLQGIVEGLIPPPFQTPDATSTVKGKLKLAGDLAGTADEPTVPGLAGKSNVGHTHSVIDVTGLQPYLSGNITPAEVFGVTGDGVTDDSQAIKAALNSGKPIIFTPGKTYRMAQAIGVDYADVYAYGAKFLVDHGGNFMHFNGAVSAAEPVSSWVAARELTSTDGATINVVKLTLPGGVPTSWKRGDVVMLAGDDIVPLTRYSDPAAESALRAGEFLTVVSVTGNVLRCSGVVWDPITTNMRVQKFESVGTSTWRGGSFDFADPWYTTGSGYFFFALRQVGLRIVDATFRRVKSAAVYMRTCHSWHIEGISVLQAANKLAQGAHGYGVANYGCAYGTLANSFFKDTRHSYTNGGTTRLAGLSDVDGFGRPHDNLIIGCVTESGSATAYDSHTQGVREKFVDCVAVNCPAGFYLRGQYHTVENGTVVFGTRGFVVATESDFDRSFGHTIDGLRLIETGTIADITVNTRSTSLFSGVKDTEPIIIKNVTARGIQERLFRFRNVTARVSGIDVSNTPSSTSLASLVSNSDVAWTDSQIESRNVQSGAIAAFATDGHPSPSSRLELTNITVRGPGTFDYVVSGPTGGSTFRGSEVRMQNLPTVSVLQSAYGTAGTPQPVVFP